MIVSRANIRAIRTGQEKPDPLQSMGREDAIGILDELDRDDRRPLPLGGGLPGDEERKFSGRSSPLSDQARTGRTSLLGDR